MNSLETNAKEIEAEKLFQYGAAKREAKQYEESIIDFTKALSINPNHIPSNMQITYSLCAIGRNKEALPYADKVIELLPDWDTYEHRASIKKSLGDIEGAEQDYQIAKGIPKDGCM
jgi:tetratricopeptide (TPR) repeat protein